MTLLQQFVNYKIERIRARIDTEFKRSVGETVCSNEKIMQPKYNIGAPVFLCSFMPRIVQSVTEPLTEPLRNTYPFEILKETIKNKLLLTPES
jgi:hypothetical protein